MGSKRITVDVFGQEFDLEQVENETKILKWQVMTKIYGLLDKAEDFFANYIPNEEEKRKIIELAEKMNSEVFRKEVVSQILANRPKEKDETEIAEIVEEEVKV